MTSFQLKPPLLPSPSTAVISCSCPATSLSHWALMNNAGSPWHSVRWGKLIRDQINRAAPEEPGVSLPLQKGCPGWAGGRDVPPGKYLVFISCRSQTLPVRSWWGSAKSPAALSVCTTRGYGPCSGKTNAGWLLSAPKASEFGKRGREGSGQRALLLGALWPRSCQLHGQIRVSPLPFSHGLRQILY